jgi:hypothetical protein
MAGVSNDIVWWTKNTFDYEMFVDNMSVDVMSLDEMSLSFETIFL